LFGGLVTVFVYDLRNGVRKIETVSVRLEAESFDFGDALDALVVQVVFERQSSLLDDFGRKHKAPEGRFRKEMCARATSIIDVGLSLHRHPCL